MRRFAQWSAVLALGLMVWTACKAAQAEAVPKNVRVSVYTLQEPDSVRIVVRWVAVPPGQRQAPLAAYETRIRQGAGTILATGTTAPSQLIDTLRLATPPLGVTIANLVAEVRAVDTLALVSGWATSSPFGFTITPLPPNSPDSVTADTTLINQLAQIWVRPSYAVIQVGGSKQFCAIGKTWGGATGLIGWETLSPEAYSACVDAYNAWKLEVSS